MTEDPITSDTPLPTPESSSYQERVSAKIAKFSDRALGALKENPEAAKEALASRATLYDWLVHRDLNARAPVSMVTDELVQVFEEAVKAGSTKDGLHAVFAKLFAGGGAILSRQSADFMWEHTGFHADLGCRTVFAKVGKTPYEPIGYDDGEHFVSTDGSKTLWAREFAMALLVPVSGAFSITRRPDYDDPEFANVFLTDAQVATYTDCAVYLRQDVADYRALTGKAITEDFTERKRDVALIELSDKMMEGIKLARARVPQLDRKLAALEKQHGNIFSDISAACNACAEFIDLILSENAVRKTITTTELGAKTEASAASSIGSTILEQLSKLVDDKGQVTADTDTVTSSLAAAYIAIPSLRVLSVQMTGDANEKDELRLVLAHLKEQYGR